VIALDRPVVLLSALVVALGVALAAGLPGRRLAAQMLPLQLFLAMLVLTLPFSVPGMSVLEVGPISASREGLALVFVILLRANAILLATLGLLGGVPPAHLAHALARLGMPGPLAHLLLMTVRQIHVAAEEYGRLRRAMRARAFVPRTNRHSWNSIGWLVGMLLVRSLSRARRVQDAMRCRGFDGRFRVLDTARWRPADSATLAAGLVLFALWLVADQYAPAGLGLAVAS
jgi:cobalt/nickel transport system permease protein